MPSIGGRCPRDAYSHRSWYVAACTWACSSGVHLPTTLRSVSRPLVFPMYFARYSAARLADVRGSAHDCTMLIRVLLGQHSRHILAISDHGRNPHCTTTCMCRWPRDDVPGVTSQTPD